MPGFGDVRTTFLGDAIPLGLGGVEVRGWYGDKAGTALVWGWLVRRQGRDGLGTGAGEVKV
jgi:hypothetical protein